jgi:hypothetical protein
MYGESHYEWDDVKSIWSLFIGLMICDKGFDSKQLFLTNTQIYKINLSSDCCLQLGNMKEESLVIALEFGAVNLLLVFVHTARHAKVVITV